MPRTNPPKPTVLKCEQYDPWPGWNGPFCLNCGRQGKHPSEAMPDEADCQTPPLNDKQ